jgi:hypothetical protein
VSRGGGIQWIAEIPGDRQGTQVESRRPLRGVLRHDLGMPRPELENDFESGPDKAHDSDGIGLIQVVDGPEPMGHAKYRCDLFISAVSDSLRADPQKGAARENRSFHRHYWSWHVLPSGVP